MTTIDSNKSHNNDDAFDDLIYPKDQVYALDNA